eukprot:COSAG06_NODE_18478_length_885_cov_2.834606_2_plen_75_part_01
MVPSRGLHLHYGTQLCTSYTQCTVRLCQLHSQTLKPSFLRPPQGKTAGLGVVGERAEEAAKDYQAGHEDDPGAGG